MKKILIIGSTGFLGSALVQNLPESDYIVSTFNRLRHRHLNAPLLDLEQLSDQKEFLENFSFDVVVDCSWDGVEKRDRNDFARQDGNIHRIFNNFQFILKRRVPIYIALGSQAEAEPSSDEVQEELLNSDSSEYSRAKSQLAELILSYPRSPRTRVVWARVFSVFGPGDHTDSLTNLSVKAFLENKLIDIHQPELEWSFLYVTDFVTAIQAIIESSDISGVVNIANPNMERIGNVTDYLKQFNPDLKGPSVREEISLQEANSKWHVPIVNKLNKAGWKPMVGLRDGLKILTHDFK
jgi:nucleoside-diphosphate-sugar epimerase